MIGTRLAHYEITSHLGTGGMGEVYQATDSKLGRSVAIKLLPEAVMHDPDRAARFEREARVLASLNHPNIAAIHGIEDLGGRKFLVMELVDGETLADRIKRGPIPLEESLQIATQISEALEAAHEKAIIHRDLKPANIKLTVDGKVKVLDFGLAKAFEAQTATTSLTNSPTINIAATQQGMILGTAAYMSPEQAKGREVDRRTDVFAFGCVLYEMLTGHPAFGGEDVAEILSRILQREPDWTLLPAYVPPRIRELLRLCLEKNVKNRRQTAADVRIDIAQALLAPQPLLDAAPPVRARASRGAWIIAAVAVLAAVVLAIPAMRYSRETDPPELRVDINTPPTTDLLSMAISPDARRIVFVASDGGQQKLWLRSMESVEAHVLAGTDGASFPFWSPNSGSIGFFAEGRLKRIDIAGGTVQTITSAVAGRGGTWNHGDVILFAESVTSPIMRVPATGGQPSPVTHLQDGQNSHRFPRFLPDDRHFLYYVNGGAQSGGSVYVGSLDKEAENHRLMKADSAAEFAASGHLLFARQGTVFAQRIDLAGLKLTGDPFPVGEKVAVDPALGAAAVTASAGGAIAIRSGGGTQQLIWFDRSGNEVGTVGAPDLDSPSSPEISPDGQRLALWRSPNGNSDIWIAELERGLLSRFTVDEGADIEPIWSADGETIFFASNRKGLYNIYRRAVNGAGSEVLALETSFSKRPLDSSRDGRFMLYGSIEPQNSYEIWALPLKEDKKPFPVAHTVFEERDGQFSPNGNWVAYRSNESGRYEVYVQAFPGPGERKQVSTGGGMQPRWNSDGKELFYIDLNSRMMAVPIHAGTTGQPLETGATTTLFTTRIALATQRTVKHQYAVARNGQRFLINSFSKDAVASPITLILNWKPPAK